MSERYQVPIGIEVATQWAWRLLVIGAAGVAGLWLLRYLSEITVPVAVAVLLTALTSGAVNWLASRGLPRLLATFAVVLSLLVVFFGMLALVGEELASQTTDLRSKVVDGITKVQNWAETGPFHLTNTQIHTWVDDAKESIASSDTKLLSTAGEVGDTVTHLVTGFFIVLFSSFFFLYEGKRIWTWIVAIFPRAARARVNSSGHAAWISLSAFVRATVLVALTDALGIAFGAWALGVPLTLAIGVLVFLGAFIPIIGALLSGLVAVLVALVAQGPWTALWMLLIVLLIQQLEAHVLQPFLMGRLVALHPLAIIFAIGVGVTAAGIVGALVAVPLAACINSIVRHLVAVAAQDQLELDGDGGPAPEPA